MTHPWTFLDSQELAKDIIDRRAEWLEDCLAGLLINGIAKERISILYWPDQAVWVCVDKVCKYEWKLEIKT